MLKIIYQDDALIVLDKPAGLVVDKSETQKEPTLEDLLSERYQGLPVRSGIVHRLDKDTSGVILIAKTQEALENLQAQFKERKTKKEYLALVHGSVMGSGKVEGDIARNPFKREKFIVTDEFRPTRSHASDLAGREAVTEYEPVQSLVMSSEFIEKTFSDFSKIQFKKLRTMNYQLYTLLVARPKTGRTHQIRVHLKYINHPIVSDEKYVGRKMYRLDKRWCLRMFLHAKSIGFYHPVSGEWMEVESEMSEDLKIALQMLTNNEYL